MITYIGAGVNITLSALKVFLYSMYYSRAYPAIYYIHQR